MGLASAVSILWRLPLLQGPQPQQRLCTAHSINTISQCSHQQSSCRDLTARPPWQSVGRRVMPLVLHLQRRAPAAECHSCRAPLWIQLQTALPGTLTVTLHRASR